MTMNFSDKDGFIWLDGEWLPWREAKVHVLTNTLHYGLGVFEGMRVYLTSKGSAIFRLEDHVNRLYDSAKLVHLVINQDKKTVLQTCVNVLKKNNLTEAYIRPMVFLGSEGMGLHAKHLKTHMMIAAWEWGAYLGEGALTQGIRIKISSYRRNHIDSLHAKAKVNGQYVNSMMALREAQICGFDEALMLDHLGFVAEGSGENFFMVKDGEVFTPSPETILLGITRDTVLKLCHDLGIPVHETQIARDSVYLADEAFFTGTAAEITPIREVDGRVIGDGKPGPITLKLQQAYFDIVKGRNVQHANWLTVT